MILYKGQNLRSGPGSAEASCFLAAVKQDDRRETPHPVLAGEFHIITLVHLQFSQPQRTRQILYHMLQDRSDKQAGRAPPDLYAPRLTDRTMISN